MLYFCDGDTARAVSSIAGWRLRQPSPFLYRSSKPSTVLMYTSLIFCFSMFTRLYIVRLAKKRPTPQSSTIILSDCFTPRLIIQQNVSALFWRSVKSFVSSYPSCSYHTPSTQKSGHLPQYFVFSSDAYMA